jgi:membrane protein implicated in regulation of membrane protease activity
MPPAVGRVALGWAAFLVLASVVLLLTLSPGTPEFVITLFTLCVVAAVVLTRRRGKREDV